MAGNHMSTQSPRQRMINMMYLVLTALLALNVSKEVLDAFFRVDQTLTLTVSEKIESADHRYGVLQKKADNNPNKVGDWNRMALTLKGETENIEKTVDSIRFELWKEGGPTFGDGEDAFVITDEIEKKQRIPTEPKTKIEDKANTHSPGIIMLGSGGEGGAGKKLKAKINNYKDFLLSLIDKTEPHSDQDRQEIIILLEDLFNTEDVLTETGGSKTWEEEQYSQYPLIGVMTFLNQTKLDIRTAEDKVLELIENKTGSSLVSIDKQIPYARPNSNYVMQGDSLFADLFLAGIDTQTLPEYDLYEMFDGSKENHYHPMYPMDSKNPQVLPRGTVIEAVNDSLGNPVDYIFKPDSTYKIETISSTIDGMGTYKEKMSSTGTQSIGGFVSVPSDQGMLRYPWVMEIKVEKPMPVIAADNLKVIYAGLDNEFTIAAPGHDPKYLTLVSNAGQKLKITKQSVGKYKLKIEDKYRSSTPLIKLSIKDTKTGKTIGRPMDYNVKKTPEPSTTINGKAELSGDCEMTLGQLKTARNLQSQKDPSFVYNLRYNVIEYKFLHYDASGNRVEEGPFTGSKIDKGVQKILSNARSGALFKFYDIKTKTFQNNAPTGAVNDAESINIYVK